MTEPTKPTGIVLNGVEQPKRIWLICYRHAGDICWTSVPNPEDADEIETVEYVRADTICNLVEALTEMVAAAQFQADSDDGVFFRLARAMEESRALLSGIVANQTTEDK